jgi:outer membrane cobalamin receptor
VISSVNALSLRISGLEIEAAHRLTSRVRLFSNVTHFFSRREEISATAERDILNVASDTIRVGIDVDAGALSSRVLARFVHDRQDQDFNVPGFPVVDYPDFTVVDLSAMYRLHPQHAVVLTVNNLFDRYYYEKMGYPLQGIGVTLGYQIGR